MDGMELLSTVHTATTVSYEQATETNEYNERTFVHTASVRWESWPRDPHPIPKQIEMTVGGLTYTYEAIGFRVGA